MVLFKTKNHKNGDHRTTNVASYLHNTARDAEIGSYNTIKILPKFVIELYAFIFRDMIKTAIHLNPWFGKSSLQLDIILTAYISQ
jgi:hypothetical protein